jgi:hypothetical protein
VIVAVLVPALALLAYLTVWAYRVRDWTWFSLLLAAGIGLLAFAAAPQLFSLAEAKPASSPYEWCRTMTSPQQSDKIREHVTATTCGPSNPIRKTKAPDRTA